MKQLYLVLFLTFVFSANAQVVGCTDPMATNYNSAATENDGSCVYSPTSVAPDLTVELPAELHETSGLIHFNGGLLTHNDSRDTNLYSLDSLSGEIISRTFLQNVRNYDWEEIAQDDTFIYVGDFGNNAGGNRSDLRILRISKESLSSTPIIDTIAFSYADQPLPLPARLNANKTDFDCEAFIVTATNIYLFTKQWTSRSTGLYRIPKLPGAHSAELLAALDVNGLVTGATFHPASGVIALSGYDGMVRPFLYLLYDYYGDNFFAGNIRRIELPMQFHQIEGISTLNGVTYYLTNERLKKQPLVNVAPKLHRLDLAPYLSFFVSSSRLTTSDPLADREFVVYQNRQERRMTIRIRPILNGAPFFFLDQAGTIMLQGVLSSLSSQIDLSTLHRGIYQLRIGETVGNTTNVIID
ncbi:MAG TPA: T9SS C-terminal target domain-containing protein [Flavobacterium sp.]